MFSPRKIESSPEWSDSDGIKIYTISAHQRPVDQAPYLERLAEVKEHKAVPWATTPAFAIFHEGAKFPYLILAWWGNDNELFTSVSVNTDSGWVEDSAVYSFCVYDLEVFWHERNFFVKHMYCSTPRLESYRSKRYKNG